MINCRLNNNCRPGFVSLFVVALISLIVACEQKIESQYPEGTWVDLSYPFDDQTIFWPTAEPFKLDTIFVGNSEQGFFYSAFKFATPEHGGTHLDAPFHFANNTKTTDQLSIDDLSGPGIVIDVSEKALSNPDYLVSVDDFTNWEHAYGVIPDDVILLIRTGYGRFWPDRKRYLGTEVTGEDAISQLHFPGIAPEAATWLITNRNIKAIGIDTPSIDYGQSENFESHRIIYKENIPGFENVANLDQLPITGFWIIALPMKIAGGSGGPLRIAALIPD